MREVKEILVMMDGEDINGHVPGSCSGGERARVWRNVKNPLLWRLAHENRLHPTEAESIMWESLRTKFYGCKFRRQQIIGNYIVDFVCVQKGLVVEIDGEYHNSEEQKKYDSERTEYLASKGFIVMRFTNDEVLSNLNGILTKIKKFIIKELI